MSEFVQEFFTSRQNYPDGNTRIGQLDRLWYDSNTNTIRISDGITPGGIIVSGGGGGPSNWVVISSNYTAYNGQKIIADTSGGPFTLYLPASPVIGSYIQVFGSSLATNNLTVDGNGSTIEGSSLPVVLNDPNTIYDFIYDGATWQLIAGGGGGGPGTSGYSGFSGRSGYSGASGYTGASGSSGYSGSAGTSGYSGFSGAGTSGYSGYSGVSGALSPWTLITSNYNAVNGDRLIADTQGGSFTIYLPPSPSVGDYVQITDGWNFNLINAYVDPNGSTIENLPDIVALDLSGCTFEFIYQGTTWEVTATTGARGTSGFSGYSGEGGSGASGYSGYSGAGVSGYSGEPGASGYSGFSGVSGALSPWTLITSNYNAVNGDRLIADTQAGAFTIYLPSSPFVGDYVQITDGWNFNLINAYVDPNGSTIENLPDIVALDLSGCTFEFIYQGTTWEVTATTGARGTSGYSGYSGIGGSGTSGYSGYSGQGESGYSGVSGESGISGYSGVSGALSPWTLITSNYFSQNGDRLIADTSSGGFTILLPPSPVTGDYVQITDGFNFNLINCYVDPNGSTVENLPDIVVLDLAGCTFEFIYNATWEVTATTGARGTSGYSGYSGASPVITNETASSSTFYPLVSDSTTGSLETGYTSDTKLYYIPNTGQLSATTFNPLSDSALKSNITPITNALDLITALEGVNFTWTETGLPSTGLIAQQVEKILPALVSDAGGFKTVNYDAIIGILVEAIKELYRKNSSVQR